jgi:hypothetical protein
MIQFSPFAKAEYAANHLGYHAFFVCANDADGNRPGRRGNHAIIRRASLFVEFDSKEVLAHHKS